MILKILKNDKLRLIKIFVNNKYGKAQNNNGLRNLDTVIVFITNNTPT